MKFYSRKRRMPAVIIVSLIDILAILLIFVIVTTTFKQSQPEVVIKLPQSGSAVAAQNNDVPEKLTVEHDGTINFQDMRVTYDKDHFDSTEVEKLTARLRDFKEAAVALNADTNAPFGAIIGVLDILKRAGVKNVPALTESKNR